MKIETRGLRSEKIPASFASRLCSMWIDFSIFLIATCLFIRIQNYNPLPSKLGTILFFALSMAVIFIELRFFGQTLGQKVLGLEVLHSKGSKKFESVTWPSGVWLFLKGGAQS